MIAGLSGLPKSICKRLRDSGVVVGIICMSIGVCGLFGGDEVRGVEDWVGLGVAEGVDDVGLGVEEDESGFEVASGVFIEDG